MAADYTCQTVNPNDPTGPRTRAILPARLTLFYYKYRSVQYENLRCAKFVLESPARIFFGVREYNEGGWCYTGKPPEWHVTPHRVEPFPEDMVYSVYLNPKMRVYEIRAEYADSVDPLCPINWENRYRGLTWKSTSSPTK